MSSTFVDQVTERSKLMIRSYNGFEYRDVKLTAPRDCLPEEVPVLDLGGLDGDDESRSHIARLFLQAAEKTGFFYVENHGISQEVLDSALEETERFFHLPLETKMKAASNDGMSSYGYKPKYSRSTNPTSGLDRKEGFSFHYEPRFDPMHEGNLHNVPQAVLAALPKDSHTWNDVGLPGFQPALLAYYRSMLALARKMIRIVAIALEVPEDYFDAVTKYPGGDASLNFYPANDATFVQKPGEVGLGAHTDLQILTFLYQSDDERGLQVLNSDNSWVYAPPRPGTFVVNIGDFLMRLTNDRLKSTVHRVIHHSRRDRISIPFHFGFDFNEKCGVIPTCVSPGSQPRYQPASCGELIAKRLAMGIPDTVAAAKTVG